ncbi:MAG: acyltransferase [Bdellovibrionaceae bacterium]|nr:acyltransferase [Bdellovibrio sp.]
MTENKLEFFYYINYLRALAILMVVFTHLNGLSAYLRPADFQFWGQINDIITAGKHGVSLFFVVSAYTLCRSLFLRSQESHSRLKYFIRRYFRIAPAYYLILLIIFFSVGEAIPDNFYLSSTLSWQSLLMHFSFLNGLTPAHINNFLGVEWSVAAEFLFYLLLPAYFFFILRQRRLFQALTLILTYFAAVVLACWLYLNLKTLTQLGGSFHTILIVRWCYFFIGSHFHEFTLGVVAWFILDYWKFTFNQFFVKILFYLMPLIYIVAAYAEVEYWSGYYSGLIQIGFWGLYFLLLLITFNQRPPKLNRFFNKIGELSFSIYLVHFPIFYYFSQIFYFEGISEIKILNAAIFIVTTLSATVACSFFLYHIVERFGINCGQRLTEFFDK